MGSWWLAILLSALAATAVIAPMPFLGNASGHDFQFHLQSWMEVAKQWHEGVFYPRWAAWANYGFGEPRFIFYPPVSWLLGAVLGTVLPWRMVAAAFIWIALVAAGGSMFALARAWLPPRTAVAAAVFYAVNPYHLVMVYYRSDFAELMASSLVPLAILLLIRVTRSSGAWKDIVPAAAVFAAIWLTNAPAAVITSYALALILVAEAVVTKSAWPLLRGSAALTAGLGLAAFYIFPAAFEQKWVNIGEALAFNLEPQKNFLFTHANDPEFVLFNWKISGVALAVIAITALAAVFSSATVRERRAAGAFGELEQFWWPLACLGAVSILLMFPVSAAAWRWLPKLRFVQFPWRWLVPLNVVCWLFFAHATERARRGRIWRAVMVLALVALAGLIVRDAWWDDEDAPVTFEAIHSGRGYEGTPEYAPRGADPYDMPQEAPRIAVIGNPRAQGNSKAQEGGKPATGASRPVRVHIEKWGPEEKIFVADSAEALNLAPKLLAYPAWRAEANGKTLAVQTEPGSAQMRLRLPAGSTIVQIRFGRTADRTAGLAISILAALGLLAIRLLHGRKIRKTPKA